MASILAGSWSQLKTQVICFLQEHLQVESVAAGMGLEWKNTKISLPRAMLYFAQQILLGNLSLEAIAAACHGAFTAAGLCTARQQIPLELLQEINRKLLCRAPAPSPGCGPLARHRTWMMDCTGVSMPETGLLRRVFGLPQNQKVGCGGPMAHLLLLWDRATELISDCVIAPHFSGDVTLAREVHEHIESGDIVVADAVFESYFHIAQIRQRKGHVLFPAHCGRRMDFTQNRPHGGRNEPRSRYLRTLGKQDQLVEYSRPHYHSASMSRRERRRLPETLAVREIRRTIKRRGFRPVVITLVTTLLNPVAYPAEELMKLFKDRWQVEVHIRSLKTTMNMQVLRSRKPEMIHKEIWMFLLLYNVVRLVMLKAAKAQQVPVQRISFSAALYYLRYGDLDKPMPKLKLLPCRPDRHEPRVTKQRPKTYKRMTRPRTVLRREMRQAA